MRKMFLLLSLLLAGTIAGSAKDYSHYYTNLPETDNEIIRLMIGEETVK